VKLIQGITLRMSTWETGDETYKEARLWTFFNHRSKGTHELSIHLPLTEGNIWFAQRPRSPMAARGVAPAQTERSGVSRRHDAGMYSTSSRRGTPETVWLEVATYIPLTSAMTYPGTLAVGVLRGSSHEEGHGIAARVPACRD